MIYVRWKIYWGRVVFFFLFFDIFHQQSLLIIVNTVFVDGLIISVTYNFNSNPRRTVDRVNSGVNSADGYWQTIALLDSTC